MADLLPSIPDASVPEEAEPRVVDLADDDADEVIAALSSATARELFAALADDPAHPSALADEVDTSLQNAQYHLANLEDAGLVEVVDTAYSEKGREMDIYAPADRPLVVFAGDDEDGSLLRSALNRLLGGWAVLAAVAVAVQGLFGGEHESLFSGGSLFQVGGDAAGGASDDGGDATSFDASGDGAAPTASDGGDSELTSDGARNADGADGGGGAGTADGGEQGVEIAEPAVDAVGTIADDLSWVGDVLAAGGLEPGAAIFVFGTFLLLGAVGTWYVRRR